MCKNVESNIKGKHITVITVQAQASVLCRNMS